MEDIEEYYEEENEKNNEEFINKLKEKGNIENVEKIYKNKSRELRNTYERGYKNNLNNEKKKEIEKIKNKVKSKKITPGETYKTKNLDLEPTSIEKFKLNLTLKNYRFKRKLNDLYDNYMPNKMIYLTYKLKKDAKRTFNDIIEFIIDTFNTITVGFSQFFTWVFKVTGSILQKINTTIKNLLEKIFKKKKEDKKEDGNAKKEESSSTKEQDSEK